MIVALNLVLRFALELTGLFAMGWWGFATQAGPVAWLAGLGIPLVMAILWGVFRVPNDGGPPLVVTPPRVRLLLEGAFFALAVGLLSAGGQVVPAAVLLLLVIVSYAIDWRRTTGLVAGKVPATNGAFKAFGQEPERRREP